MIIANPLRLLGIAGAAVIVTGLALAQNQSIPPVDPDPTLTPGAIATSDPHEICAIIGGLTYTKRHRTWDRKAETLAKYGIGLKDARLYEDDDRVPVCLGGDNANPKNHWPQPWPQARIKDRLDAESCHLVCTGRVDVKTAQGWFLGDWRQGYRAVFHEEPGQ